MARTLFRPVRDGNAFEATVERLATAIRLGAVTDRLPPERELATMLGVSRMTLRDALQALADAGYVTSRRGRGGGTFVRFRLPADQDAHAVARSMGETLTHALDYRRIIEPGAAALAAETTLSAAEQQYLTGCLAEVADATEDAVRRRADSRLHLAIASVTGNAPLIAAVADVQGRLSGLLELIPVLRHNIAHSDAQHAEIVEAILAGDRERAAATMTRHCDGTAALLRGFLR
ncbi:FadR/GntR family transcriptional regulator [Cryptosporangium aurantiacum]|uniref:FadR/GntR family transcriptional regulator n=1 Tax=Cryptosporangium aurantiacum TaxID=134849 RepID=UPI001C4A44AA|nr:FCD domain-containing protein [Cryptosporangium aurantiacum]